MTSTRTTTRPGPAIWAEQFDTARDFPERPAPPSTRYVIASTPRCGSHYLGQMLAATRRLGDPLEYFNPANLQRWQQAARAAGEPVHRHIERRRTSPNGCFGMKLHLPHVRAAAAELGPDRLFGDHRFVFVRREDLLAQAISHSIAQQTGAWISMMEPQREPAYDTRRITANLVQVIRHNAQWRVLLDTLAGSYVEVTYEQVRRAPAEAVRRIAAACGVDLGDVQAPAPPTRRQGGERNEAWRERYLDDIAAAPGDLLDLLCDANEPRRTTRQRAAGLVRRALTALGRG